MNPRKGLVLDANILMRAAWADVFACCWRMSVVPTHAPHLSSPTPITSHTAIFRRYHARRCGLPFENALESHSAQVACDGPDDVDASRVEVAAH
jgi:hypothetical protein